MPWTAEGGWTDPWLPLTDTSRNVEEERADTASTLHFTRDLIALRRGRPELQSGDYEELPAPSGAWAWRRGENVTIALNLGRVAVDIAGIEGTIELATERDREDEKVTGHLHLAPAEGAVVVT